MAEHTLDIEKVQLALKGDQAAVEFIVEHLRVFYTDWGILESEAQQKGLTTQQVRKGLALLVEAGAVHDGEENHDFILLTLEARNSKEFISLFPERKRN